MNGSYNFFYSKSIEEITCEHDDIAKAFNALYRPVWEFLIALMSKQIILKVKLV